MFKFGPLTDENHLNNAKSAFDKVFRSFDPFGSLFQQTIKRRAIIELSAHIMDEPIWRSVAKCAVELGD